MEVPQGSVLDPVLFILYVTAISTITSDTLMTYPDVLEKLTMLIPILWFKQNNLKNNSNIKNSTTLYLVNPTRVSIQCYIFKGKKF